MALNIPRIASKIRISPAIPGLAATNVHDALEEISSVTGGITQVTSAELYNGVDGLVDLAALVPGRQYQITDHDNVIVEALTASTYQVETKEVYATVADANTYIISEYPGVTIVGRLSTDPEPAPPADPLVLDHITDTGMVRASYVTAGWQELGLYAKLDANKCFIPTDLTPSTILARQSYILLLGNVTRTRHFTIKSSSGYGGFTVASGWWENNAMMATDPGDTHTGCIAYMFTYKDVSVVADCINGDPVIWQAVNSPFYYTGAATVSGIIGGGRTPEGTAVRGYVLTPQEYALIDDTPEAVDISSLTTLDLTGVTKRIITLTSSNATETIDTISNPPAWPLELRPAAGLAVTFAGTAYGSIAANGRLLWQGNIAVNGDYGDSLELRTATINNGSAYTVWKVKARSIYG